MSNTIEQIERYYINEYQGCCAGLFSNAECDQLLVAFEGMCEMDMDSTKMVCNLPEEFLSYMTNNYSDLSTRLRRMDAWHYTRLFLLLSNLAFIRRMKK